MKEGLVTNFGHYNHGVCKWEVEIRRQTFYLEIEIWEEFFGVLYSVYLDDNVSDRTIWTLEPSGVLSYKLFRKRMTTSVPMIFHLESDMGN